MGRSPFDDAQSQIRDALERAARPAISCSFQPGGVALLHLMGKQRRSVPVLFVDTGYHFQETLEFKDRVAEMWGLDLRSIRADQSTEAQQEYLGPLYRTNPDQCCEDRKTGPLFAALDEYDVWMTGLRRDQTDSRRDIRVVERRLLPSGRVVTKVNPIADWTAAELEAYTAIHEIPVHPLMDQGYPSIGCAPCTAGATDGSRAGRWSGAKIECGLHTSLERMEGAGADA
jgi:phosphoadenosine phosphosulfate reductase